MFSKARGNCFSEPFLFVMVLLKVMLKGIKCLQHKDLYEDIVRKRKTLDIARDFSERI